METLFKPGTNVPQTNNDNTSVMPAKKHTPYLLGAVFSLKDYIDSNPFKFKNSSDLLDHLNTPGRGSLEKTFKAIFGARIKEYMVIVKLNEAKEMMKKGLPKKMIARKCLYKSSSAFSTAFRIHFGISPTEWERTIPTDELGKRSKA